MTERRKAILKTIIEEYIRDADPVGSKRLSEKFDFGIGPAMMRQEMALLEEEGCLISPHTSAGRVPTDKAYRLYIVQDLKNKNLPLSTREQKRVRDGLSGYYNYQDLIKEISKLSAEISKELSVAGLVGEDVFFTSGFGRIMEEPELQNFEHISHLMSFIDDMDRCFNTLWKEMIEENLRVFVGGENPIREIKDFSLITGRYRLPQGRTGFISIVGPRRMNYKKNMALVEYITKSIEELKI